ncbi:MAG: 50S ribosomal protein L25 [Candidatus Caldatribacteriota bacterium]|nr:50S ribosomal protein L25 [Candidatus Caldatribacteriota bacterium]
MDKTKLKAELRNETGKGANRKFRKEGMVSGVLYSPHDKKNLLLKMKSEELTKLLIGKKYSLINLEIDDGKKKNKRLVMVKDFQYNSLKRQVIHIDFYGVTLKEKITMQINVELIGESKGVKEGGILEFELREIEVECLPSQVPGTFKVDITNLEITDNFSVGDIEVPKGVKILTETDRVIVSVKHPAKEEVKVEEVEGEEVEETEEDEETADKTSSETKEGKDK